MTKIILLLLLVGVEWNNAYQIFRNTGTLLRKISNIWGMYLVVFCHWHNKRLYEVGIRYEYAKYQRSWTTLFHVAWPERNFVTREHSKQQQPFIDSQTIDFIYIYIYIKSVTNSSTNFPYFYFEILRFASNLQGTSTNALFK